MPRHTADVVSPAQVAYLVCLIDHPQQPGGCLHACCQRLLVVECECDVLLQQTHSPEAVQ